MQIHILQQVIPEYRVPFFNKLSKRINIKLHYGSKGLGRGVVSCNNSKFEFQSCEVRNITFLSKFIFQLFPLRIYFEDIVVMDSNLRSISFILIFFIRKLFSKPNIIWTHGLGSSNSIIIKKLTKKIFHLSDAIVLYDSIQKDEIIKIGISAKKIFIINNCIDLDSINSINPPNNNKFRITFIGRLTKEKKVDLLIEAFLEFIDKYDNKDITLTIIGDGDIKNQLKKLARGSDNIFFSGAVYDEGKVSYYLNQTIATVSPDNAGLMIQHSFAYSVPIIMNAKPNIRHGPESIIVKEKVTGILFDGTSNDLVSAILFAVSNKKYMQDLGTTARSLLYNSYSMESMADSFVESIMYLKIKNSSNK